jgi:hypothetical protein
MLGEERVNESEDPFQQPNELRISTPARVRADWIEAGESADSESYRKADVLMVPSDGFREIEGYVYPVGATLLRDHFVAAGETSVEMWWIDDEYQESHLHSELVVIGTIILSYLVAPTVTGLLTNYIQRLIDNRTSQDETRFDKSPRVQCKLVVEGEGESVQLEYSGSVEGFQAVLEELKARGHDDEYIFDFSESEVEVEVLDSREFDGEE